MSRYHEADVVEGGILRERLSDGAEANEYYRGPADTHEPDLILPCAPATHTNS